MEKVSNIKLKKLNKLDLYNLDNVCVRLKNKGVSNPEKLEHEFKRLASLWILQPKKSVAPSEKVDTFWHELILDTNLYNKFCSDIFGKFIHHVPNDSTDIIKCTQHKIKCTRCDNGCSNQKANTLSDHDIYEKTLKQYQKFFGTPSEEFWPRH